MSLTYIHTSVWQMHVNLRCPRQNPSCIFRPVALRYSIETKHRKPTSRLAPRLASSRRFARRIILRRSDSPKAVRSLHTTEEDAMSGWGLKGYAQWGVAMVTSIPIWAGASVVTLFQFARECGPLPLTAPVVISESSRAAAV